MNIRIIALILLGILVIAGLLFVFQREAITRLFTRSTNLPVQQTDQDRSPSATIRGTTYTLEVARTQEELLRGLSGRESLEENRGMLFIFEQPDIYTFWMKDMRFPLDIIFIRQDVIVSIFTDITHPQSPNEQPQRVTSVAPADRVLELRAGEVKKHNIQNGDRITFNNL
jgi:hypothetical protein